MYDSAWVEETAQGRAEESTALLLESPGKAGEEVRPLEQLCWKLYSVRVTPLLLPLVLVVLEVLDVLFVSWVLASVPGPVFAVPVPESVPESLRLAPGS